MPSKSYNSFYNLACFRCFEASGSLFPTLERGSTPVSQRFKSGNSSIQSKLQSRFFFYLPWNNQTYSTCWKDFAHHKSCFIKSVHFPKLTWIIASMIQTESESNHCLTWYHRQLLFFFFKGNSCIIIPKKPQTQFLVCLTPVIISGAIRHIYSLSMLQII